MGLLNEQQMIRFYQSLDLYVHATVAETLSTSILQAMSCALPIVTSNIKNNLNLIKHDTNGILYEKGNSNDLYEKLKYCITNYPTVCKLGLEARNKCQQQFSNQVMSTQYQQILTP